MGFSREDEGRLGDSLNQAYHVALKFNSDLVGARDGANDRRKADELSQENACSVCGFQFPAITSQLFSLIIRWRLPDL